MDNLTILILAAGKGTRMKSELAKVLHPVCGRPMVEYVLDVAAEMTSNRPVVVVGHQADEVEKVIGARAKCVLQSPQLGTGHAVMVAAPLFSDSPGDLLLLYGDVPLIKRKTVSELVETHRNGNYAATVLSSFPDDPTGYGRIVRNPDGSLARIIEHKDATDEERNIKEINTGICCFSIQHLIPALAELSDNNSQKEYYITDIPEIFNRKGLKVGVVAAADAEELDGINTLEQLGKAELVMKNRHCEV